IMEAGGRRAHEEAEDCRFTYYTRYFASRNGGVPRMIGPLLSDFPTYSLLTLPGDKKHWSVTIYTSKPEPPTKQRPESERWSPVSGANALHKHWLDGEAMTDVMPIAGIMDRYRRFVVDGVPIATGVLAVADAWACTNPSAGRGISVGMMHAVRLRDVVRDHIES